MHSLLGMMGTTYKEMESANQAASIGCSQAQEPAGNWRLLPGSGVGGSGAQTVPVHLFQAHSLLKGCDGEVVEDIKHRQSAVIQ